jgi:hypothetical protein
MVRAVGFSSRFDPTVLKPEVSYRAHAIGFGLGVTSAALLLPLVADATAAENGVE